MVEQPPLRHELVGEELRVRRQLGNADVLGEADRADGVEAGLRHVPVVAEPHVDVVGQSPLGGLLAPPLGLLAGQGHRDDVDAVVLGGVHGHAAPAAADVQQPHARPEPQLPADEVELLALRLLQGRAVRRVDGAGVGHRRPQHPGVEEVGDVVVVGDGQRVPATGVAAQPGDVALGADLLRRRLDPVHRLAAQGPQHLEPLGQGEVAHLGAGHGP